MADFEGSPLLPLAGEGARVPAGGWGLLNIRGEPSSGAEDGATFSRREKGRGVLLVAGERGYLGREKHRTLLGPPQPGATFSPRTTTSFPENAIPNFRTTLAPAASTSTA